MIKVCKINMAHAHKWTGGGICGHLLFKVLPRINRYICISFIFMSWSIKPGLSRTILVIAIIAQYIQVHYHFKNTSVTSKAGFELKCLLPTISLQLTSKYLWALIIQKFMMLDLVKLEVLLGSRPIKTFSKRFAGIAV